MLYAVRMSSERVKRHARLMSDLSDEVRHAEVVREFDAAQGLAPRHEPEEWTPAEHALYQPPWRMRTTTGRLGGNYGPSTASAYAKACAEFDAENRDGVGSAALWDKDEHARLHPTRASASLAARAAQRHDHELVALYVERHSGEVPTRELEAFCAYWLDGLSPTMAGRRMGVTRATVQVLIRRLRARVSSR